MPCLYFKNVCIKPYSLFQVKVSSNPPKIYSLDIVSDIRLRYSLTKVSSKVANPSDVAQETTFNVVLPETAFISSFLMYNNHNDNFFSCQLTKTKFLQGN